jgi:hypothetical protein
MFTGKNRVSSYLYLGSFEGNRILWDFLCNCNYNQAALALLIVSSVAELGIQRVNIELNED